MPEGAFEPELKVKQLTNAEINQRINEVISEWLADAGDTILAESQKRVPVGATAGLKESGHRRPGKPSDWVEVRYTAPYAAFVHEGTKPHWPPMEAIRRWVELVLNPPENEVDRVTFLVARKIARFGTKPVPFLKDAGEVVFAALEADLQRKIQEAFAQMSVAPPDSVDRQALRPKPGFEVS